MKKAVPVSTNVICASILGLGILSALPCGAAQFTRGDVNQDSGMDLSDAVAVLQYLFTGEFMPECLDAADADDSGSIDISDAYAILSFLFLGGKPPADPYPGCGEDGSPDGLDCGTFSRCEGGQVVILIGRTVSVGGAPLPGARVTAGTSSALSGKNGEFFVGNVPVTPSFHVDASAGPLKGSKDVSVEEAAGHVKMGDVVLMADQDECGNVVGRAAERGCGRVFAWGDEHVAFDSYLLFTEAFWGNAMGWLSEKTCEPGTRTRIGNYNGFHEGVGIFLESLGFSVTRLHSLSQLDQIDILVANGTMGGEAGAGAVKDWVEAGGALMTLVVGIGDHYSMDCAGGNPLISPLGLEYDCRHSAPSGPASAFGSHPIAAGLEPRNAPFVNGRWVVDLPGFSSDVVARVGDDCSPPEVSDCARPAGFEDDPPPDGNIEVVNDCTYGYNHDTDPSTGEPELHIIGIYEGRMGRVTVNVNRTVPMVLVLSSYSTVQWTVVPGSGASIEKVILNGYDKQLALLPEGIPVESHSVGQGNYLAMGYGNDCGGGDTPGLIAGAEALTGLTMRSFHGCYVASEFTIVGTSPDPEPGLKVIGRIVDELGEPILRARVLCGWREDFSVATGSFALDHVTPASPLTVVATRGRLTARKDIEFDPSSGLTVVDAGDIVLVPAEPPQDPSPPSCANVVGRAAERGCGRVFVWGDEHVKFDSYLLFSEGFWHNAMDWLSEKACEPGRRARVGNFMGFHDGVKAILEARGLTVTQVGSLDQLDQYDILVAQAHTRDIPGAGAVAGWVEAGGALMTLVSGTGDQHQEDCFSGNELISALGLSYDCGHAAPWGPVAAFGSHPIAAGLDLESAPFCNGRWVADLPGSSSDVVARIGDDCSPPEVPVIDCRVPPGFGDGTPPDGEVEVTSDCEDAYNEDTDPSTGEPELHIIGIYEAKMGRVTVDVNRTVPMVLVLSSYSSVQWTVTPGEGAVIEKVILNGYDDQLAVVPEGIPVESHSIQQGNYLATGYGNDCGGGNTPGLIAGIEGLTGLTLRSFHGCYRASAFTFTQ